VKKNAGGGGKKKCTATGRTQGEAEAGINSIKNGGLAT